MYEGRENAERGKEKRREDRRELGKCGRIELHAASHASPRRGALSEEKEEVLYQRIVAGGCCKEENWNTFEVVQYAAAPMALYSDPCAR